MLSLLLAPIATAADCDNAFLPHESGWVWQYSGPTGQMLVYHYNYNLQPSAQKFVQVRETVQGGKKQRQEVSYQCVDGNLTSLEVPQFGRAIITKASVSGVDIPAAPLWKEGYSWASLWNLQGKQGMVSSNSTFERHYRIVGRESINVPSGLNGGKAEAWRVEVTLRVTGKAAFMHNSRDIGRYTVWYADGWGLLREQRKAGVTELQKLSGPEE